MSDEYSQIDQIDRKILRELAAQGRIPVTQLAAKVGISKTPCQNRIRRLEAAGYIRGYRAVLDPEKLDKAHVAFVEVKLTDTREPALAQFNAAVLRCAEIEQCYMIAGSFDYLLKVRTRDIAEYRRVLGETVSQLPFVASTSTNVSMQAVKGGGL